MLHSRGDVMAAAMSMAVTRSLEDGQQPCSPGDGGGSAAFDAAALEAAAAEVAAAAALSEEVLGVLGALHSDPCSRFHCQYWLPCWVQKCLDVGRSR